MRDDGAWVRGRRMLKEEQHTGVVYDPEQCTWAVFIEGEIIGWRTKRDDAQKFLNEIREKQTCQ